VEPIRTHAGQWVLWEVATGQQIVRWPVDAQGMVASGEYRLAPPDGVTPELPPAPPAVAGAPPTLPPGTTTTIASGQPLESKRVVGKKRE